MIIKKYDEFVNEGLGSFLSKKFYKGEIDNIIKGIIRSIKNDFKISKLEKKYIDALSDPESRKLIGYDSITYIYKAC